MVWQDTDVTDPTHTLILLALADYANDEGVCWPGWDSIAKKARCSRSTVWRIVKALIVIKKIQVDSGGGKWRTNTYRLKLKPFHNETVTPSKPSHPETIPSHPETHTVSSYETLTVKNRHEPPTRGNGATHHSRKNDITKQLWIIKEALSTAKGKAKRELEKQRDALLQKETGVNLHPEPDRSPILDTPPGPPIPEEDWKAGMEAMKAEVSAVEPAKPNVKVMRQIRPKRPPKLNPQNPHPV